MITKGESKRGQGELKIEKVCLKTREEVTALEIVGWMKK